jgi:hypothetical protein
MFASMLRVCLWYVASSMRPTFSVSDKKRTGACTGALFLPPGRGSQRGLGQGVRGMAHILHGIECPPSDGAFSDRPGAIVGRIVRRESSNPVVMSITARPDSSSGFHGGATTTAPYTAGLILPESSSGQVGSAASLPPHPPPPLNVSCRGFLRCWWARIPMFCVMLEFWRLLLLVLDPFAATFDVA